MIFESVHLAVPSTPPPTSPSQLTLRFSGLYHNACTAACLMPDAACHMPHASCCKGAKAYNNPREKHREREGGGEGKISQLQMHANKQTSGNAALIDATAK